MPLPIKIVDTLFLVYMMMLFARILSSWFPEYKNSKIVQFLAFYTDPYLNIFRRIIPPLGMLDISPIVAFFALQVIEIIVKSAVAMFL
jgi:YggT family protein